MGIPPASTGRKTILIIEDNTINLKLFNDLLEYHNYTTVITGLGEAAVELARQHRPDLILMDIQLPDISGMEGARRLKADADTKAVPIIAVTAFAMSDDREKILASGCNEYLAKPFSVTEFLGLIERYTSGPASSEDA